MTDRRKIKKILSLWIIFSSITLVIGYGIFQAKNLATGPQLAIISPAQGSTLASPLAHIRGHAENISFITLNDNKIFTDESGNWSENILLASGYNIITVEAKDRFGRTVRETLQVMHK